MRVVVEGERRRPFQIQPVGPRLRPRPVRHDESPFAGAHRQRLRQVRVLAVGGADRRPQGAWRPLPAHPGVLVGVAGAERQQQVAAALGVAGEALQQSVVRRVERRRHQRRQLLPRLGRVDDGGLGAGVEAGPVAGVEDPLVGAGVGGRLAGERQARLEPSACLLAWE